MIGKFDRLKDAPWFPQGKRVYTTVCGAGGTGSWTAFALSRAGFQVNIYDFDTIEDHNLGGQMFKKSQIGDKKVEAVAKNIKDFVDEDVIIFDTPFVKDEPLSNMVFSCFDNMKARKELYEDWKDKFGSTNEDSILIDMRLSVENLQIFCVTKNTLNKYEKFLYTDEEVPELACTFKQTTHSAMMIASHAVAFFTNHITNVFEEEEIRNVPFFWEYIIPLDILNYNCE